MIIDMRKTKKKNSNCINNVIIFCTQNVCLIMGEIIWQQNNMKSK